MSYKQRVVTIDANTEQFVATSQMKRFRIVSKLAMVLEILFGCWHRNISRPFTLSGWTYEVCLNCGKKFAYTRAEIGCIFLEQKSLAIHHESHKRTA